MRTLDDVLGGEIPKSIKIDVEAYEAEVLNGAATTIADGRLKSVIVETLDENVPKVLGAADFVEAFYDPVEGVLKSAKFYPSGNSILVRQISYIGN